MAPVLIYATPTMHAVPATCAVGLAHPSRTLCRPAFRSSSKLAPRPSHPHRRAPIAPRAGLLDFFTGGTAPKSSPQKDELVQELYEAVEGTEAGLKANAATRERIAELVRDLPCPVLCAARARAPNS